MSQINCIVVTPEMTALEAKADFVALPLYDGEIGIGAGHSPMIGRLGFGEMRLRTGGKVERYYVDGGFVQVADNVVSVLTNRAIRAEQVNAEVAQQQLDTAQQQVANTDELLQKRDRAVSQARAMLRAARHANQ
jgi:F-type H+-transporting ATPase subunit epsilon